MPKYDLDFGTVCRNNSSYITVKIKNVVTAHDWIGDQIGIDKNDNCLEFDKYIDIDDEDIKDFIKENFNNSKSVYGFIRRLKD